MFGMEKKGRREKALLEFDLEKELRANPEKAKKTLKEVEEKIVEIKDLLRKGGNSKEFDQLGVLLHGYTALQRVIKRIEKK